MTCLRLRVYTHSPEIEQKLKEVQAALASRRRREIFETCLDEAPATALAPASEVHASPPASAFTLVGVAREAVRARHAGARWAIRNLAADDAAIKAALVQAGAAAALVAAANEAVRARHADALEKACGALTNLTIGNGFEARLQALMLRCRPARPRPWLQRPSRRSARATLAP